MWRVRRRRRLTSYLADVEELIPRHAEREPKQRRRQRGERAAAAAKPHLIPRRRGRDEHDAERRRRAWRPARDGEVELLAFYWMSEASRKHNHSDVIVQTAVTVCTAYLAFFLAEASFCLSSLQS